MSSILSLFKNTSTTSDRNNTSKDGKRYREESSSAYDPFFPLSKKQTTQTIFSRQPTQPTQTNPTYFSQEWVPGTLSGQEDAMFINEITNPTDESETKYANKLQNYYIYKPLDPNANSILNATSFYIPNPELFNILEVFKPLDQGHDFYTGDRGGKGSWSCPPDDDKFEYKFPTNELDYVQFQANTTFGGGSNIFGLILIEQTSYNFFAGSSSSSASASDFETEQIVIKKLLELINERVSGKNSKGYEEIKDFIEVNGKEIVFKQTEGEFTITDELYNRPPNNGRILFLSLYSKGYNKGLHSLWDFKEKTHVYTVSINKNGEDSFRFGGYKLYDCDIVIEENIIILNDLINEYYNIKYADNPDSVKNSVKKNNLKKMINSEEIDNLKNEITQILNKSPYNFEFKYGSCLKIVKVAETNVADKEIIEFFIEHVFNHYYSQHPLSVSDVFRPFKNEDLGFINTYKENQDNDISKLPVSIPDAATTPRTEDLLQSLSIKNITTYPNKYSIVSKNVDGSKQGGQITPSYHPPELSIYMTIFDKDNNFHGFIYRICFLKKIFSNKINEGAKNSVDMHFCFFNVSEFLNANGVNLTGRNLDDIKSISSTITDYILDNTVINNDELYTKMPKVELNENKWHKMTLISEAPSVESINTYIKSNLTSSGWYEKIIGRVNRYVNSLAKGEQPDAIDSIVTIGKKIFDDNSLQQIYGGNNYNNFLKIFLTRNKYIGDNSRASDTLFNNKDMIINPIQFSNDLNTLSTAKIVNISSMLSPNNSPKILFLAPYMNATGQYIRSNFIVNTENNDNAVNQLLYQQKSTTKPGDVPSKPKSTHNRDIDEELILAPDSKRVRKPSKSGGTRYLVTNPIQPYKSDKKSLKFKNMVNFAKGIEYTTAQKAPTTTAIHQVSTTEPAPTTEQASTTDQILQPTAQPTSLPVIYLQNIHDSIIYIKNTYIENNNEINSFVARYYLDYINKNMKLYSQSLSLDGFINLINQSDKDKSLFIQQTYSTFLREFENLNTLVLMGNDIQEEYDAESKLPFDFLFDKLNNLFDFTQQRVDILNNSVGNFDTEMSYYNNIIITIYNYLYGYFCTEIHSRIDYTGEESEDGGEEHMDVVDEDKSVEETPTGIEPSMITFIGLYYFFIYFTIEFNNKLNTKFGNQTNIVPSSYLNNNLIEEWFETYMQENVASLSPVITAISVLNYGNYINLSAISVNTTGVVSDSIFKPILEDINKDSIIFNPTTDSYNLVIKSLYFLLDDAFVEEYLKNKYPNGRIDDVDGFLDELYKNNLSGLIFGDKLKFYESDVIKDLVRSYNKEDEPKMDTSTGGHSLKNNKKYKITRTINKKTKNNKKKTIKKNLKRRRFTKRK